MNFWSNHHQVVEHSLETRERCTTQKPVQKYYHKIAALLLPSLLFALITLFSFSSSVDAQGITALNSPEVELCFDTFGIGTHITGTLAGIESRQFAAVLNVRVDDTTQEAFCTDIHSPLTKGTCYGNSNIGVTQPIVACALQHYPATGFTRWPERFEVAARQAAIWHFSDEFRLNTDDPVYSRYATIVQDVQNKFDNGACSAIENWQLTLDPVGDVSFDQNDQEFTVKVLQGSNPIEGYTVSVNTDRGNLVWHNQSGSSLDVQTDSNGVAVVRLTYSGTGKATVTAQTSVALPIGTRIDPGIGNQKVVIPGTDNFILNQMATMEWKDRPQIVIHKFHDKNSDGIYNGADALIDWTVEMCESDGNNCQTLDLGPEGSLTVDVDAGKVYDICEIEANGWSATTPICTEDVTPFSTVWFGNVPDSSILIKKYHDLNGNGVRDEGESGLDGWAFQVRYQSPNNAAIWIPAYSGNTSNDGLLGYTQVPNHLYRIKEVMPLDGEWYASMYESTLLDVDGSGDHVVEFGNLQPGELTVNKAWLTGETPTLPPTMPAIVCLRRTGPGTPRETLVPLVGIDALPQNGEGFYCYDQLLDTVTISNLWPGTYEVTESSPAGWEGDLPSDSIAVLSGQSATVAFTNRKIEAGLGDYVWFDTNRNGIQDETDTGVKDITVSLYRGDGSLKAITKTDDTGFYSFTELQPGAYFVEFVLPADHEFSAQDQGGDDAKDSDADLATGRTIVTTLEGGEYDPTWDAGIFKTPGAPDADADYDFEKYINEQDADTVDLAVEANVGQSLSFRYEVVNTGETSITWSRLVDDVFGDLTAECGLPTNIASTQRANCTVQRAAGSFPQGKRNIGTSSVVGLNDQNDAAWYKTEARTAELAELGDYTWHDENQDGIQDVDEEFIPGVKVVLYQGDGTPTGRETTTDDAGYYIFDKLIPGDYYVEFWAIDEFAFTTPGRGDDHAKDSDSWLADGTFDHGKSNVVTLVGGESNMTIDAGLYKMKPRLELTKSDGGVEHVQPGDTISYTLRYTNSGRVAATQVVINDRLPLNTVYDAAHSTQGWICAEDKDDAGRIHCILTLASVAANTTGEVRFAVTVLNPVPTSIVEIVNQATITSLEAPNFRGFDGEVARETTRLTPPSALPPGQEPGAQKMIFLPNINR